MNYVNHLYIFVFSSSECNTEEYLRHLACLASNLVDQAGSRQVNNELPRWRISCGAGQSVLHF